MMFFKRSILAAFLSLLLTGMLVIACGNVGTTTGSGGGSTPAATASSASAVIMTASATVDGKAVTILTDKQGRTLYYRTSDTDTSVCTGTCAQKWPPLLFSGSGTPGSATTLPGTLSVSNNANGAQVEYQGHPLYTFASDTASGQTSGQNVGGVWFVATTDLQPGNTPPSGTPQATPTSRYGY